MFLTGSFRSTNSSQKGSISAVYPIRAVPPNPRLNIRLRVKSFRFGFAFIRAYSRLPQALRQS